MTMSIAGWAQRRFYLTLALGVIHLAFASYGLRIFMILAALINIRLFGFAVRSFCTGAWA